jgi:hypothetical protein
MLYEDIFLNQKEDTPLVEAYETIININKQRLGN